MKKALMILFLVAISIAAVAYIFWACSLYNTGLAWFPGFFVAILCGDMIMELRENNLSE